MIERAGKSDATTWKVLILLCAATLLLPIATLILCATMIGWRQYPLPTIFLGVYLLASLASPVMGVISLITISARSRVARGEATPAERRMRRFLILLSIMNIFAIGIWFLFFPYVIFSVGGTR